MEISTNSSLSLKFLPTLYWHIINFPGKLPLSHNWPASNIPDYRKYYSLVAIFVLQYFGVATVQLSCLAFPVTYDAAFNQSLESTFFPCILWTKTNYKPPCWLAIAVLAIPCIPRRILSCLNRIASQTGLSLPVKWCLNKQVELLCKLAMPLLSSVVCIKYT